LVEHSQRQLGQKGTKKAFLGEARAKSEHTQNQGRLRPARTLKVGTFQIPTKNGQVASPDQDDEGRPGLFLLHPVAKTHRPLVSI